MANGVVYYKREAEYDGDRTLDRSLSGTEVDGNFFFLRGYDIESVAVNSETHELTLTRVDGQKLKVNIGQEIGGVQITFDQRTGILHVVTPAGEYDVPGFLSLDSGIKIATDDTLEGNGTMTDPLRISSTEKTGTFAAADEFRDLTADNGTLTEADGTYLGKGYRIVTKENISRFGLLYNFEDVLAIKADLEAVSSPWRVPSKADWDKMLNSIEEADLCDENTRMHDNTASNKWLGTVAGEKLKATEMWAETMESTKGKDTFGFSVLPMGYIEDNGAEVGARKYAAFWSTTEEDDEQDMFIKRFDDDRSTVYQSTWDPRKKLSIRLVKDYDGSNQYNCEYVEGIGMTVECVRMNDDTVWTKVNISPKQYHGVQQEAWEDEFSGVENLTEIYLINEWDGKKWVKRQMRDGQSIFMREYNDPELGLLKYHEFILVKEDDGKEVLKDTVALLEAEIDQELRDLGADIREVASDVADLSGATDSLIDALSAETAARIAADDALDQRIQLNNGGIDRLTQELIQERNERVSADTQEQLARALADQNHENLIDRLREDLTTETNNRTAADTELQRQITRNEVFEDDGTIKIEKSAEGTKLKAHVDGKTITFDSGGEMKTNVTLVEIFNDLEPDVAHAYELHYRVSDTETVKIIGSDRINVAKDKFIKDVRLSNMNATVTEDGIIHDGPESDAALVFSFIKSDGTYELVKVNVAEFLKEVQYGDGLKVVDNVVSIKKSPDSEAFLSVDADGIRVTGIQNAINAAIAEVNEQIEQLDNKIAQVSAACETNADAIATVDADLQDAVSDLEDADEALAGRIDEVSASVATVAAGLSTETTNRTAADETLQSKIGAVSASVESLSLTYADDKINLLSNGVVIASIDATGFTKDKLIKSVDLYTVAEPDAGVAAPYIKIVWKTTTGEDITRIPLDGLVDVYQAGNGIDLQNNVFSIKLDPSSQPYLTVGANGLKLSGVENVAIGNIVTSVSPADAADQSLVRIIEGSGRFYVSNSASDIKHNDASVASILDTLLSKVAALESEVATLQSDLDTANGKIAQLESKLDEVYGDNLKTKIVDTMARTIVGYPQQIGIKLVNSLDQETSNTSEVDKIKIKFAADAEFIADNI